MAHDELFLERLTSPDIAAALTAGKTTIIVPAGAVEQHGPHLPLLVDAEHGTRLGLEVAQRLGNALVAPTIRIGCSERHMVFPGTISLKPETLKAELHDYCVRPLAARVPQALYSAITRWQLPDHSGGPCRVERCGRAGL